MITIYRVENEMAMGPYNGLSVRDMADIGLMAHNGSPNHPSPFFDGIGVALFEPFPEGYVCGFDSFDSLTNWFTDEQIDAMELLGYTLKEFRVWPEDVMSGNHQCLFNRNFATEVK